MLSVLPMCGIYRGKCAPRVWPSEHNTIILYCDQVCNMFDFSKCVYWNLDDLASCYLTGCACVRVCVCGGGT